MSVCCECCVLSGRRLCDKLITRPEESYRLWRVVCVISKNLVNEEAIARVGLQRHIKKNQKIYDRAKAYIHVYANGAYFE
jgi:hypothetical protein